MGTKVVGDFDEFLLRSGLVNDAELEQDLSQQLAHVDEEGVQGWHFILDSVYQILLNFAKGLVQSKSKVSSFNLSIDSPTRR